MFYYGYNLIIVDRELRAVVADMKAYCNLLKNCTDQYYKILTKISTTDIPSGAVHVAVEKYSAYAAELSKMADGIGSKFETVINNYLHDVEEADGFLYDSGILAITRDYSKETYSDLLKCLDDPWCSITDNFQKFLDGKFFKLLDFLNLDFIKEYLLRDHKRLLDYNDAVRAEIEVIFDAVYACDKSYCTSIADIISGNSVGGKLGPIVSTLEALTKFIKQMAEIINPQNGKVTASKLQKLDTSYAELYGFYDSVINIQDVDAPLTLPELNDFAAREWIATFFDPFDMPYCEFIDNLGLGDAAMQVLFQMFMIAKNNLTNLDVPLSWEEFRSEYSKDMMKEHMLEILKENMANYNYEKSDEKDMIDDAKLFFKYVRKYGKEFYEYMNEHRLPNGKLLLDGRTVEARQYRDFLDSVGDVETILKIGDEAADYLAALFTDYQKGLEMIDSLENNLGKNEQMEECIEEIRALYNKEFGAWATDALERVADMGYDMAFKALTKANPVGVVIGTIEKTLKVTGELTGLGAVSKATLEAENYSVLQSELKGAYYQSVKKLQAMDPADTGYSKALEDTEHCFNLLKSNTEKLYETMAKATSGTESSYYEYLVRKASSMSMRDEKPVDILSYEEFCAL